MNVDLPTVSIAIVTFNSARYIRRCLNAVMQQEGVRLRVVVADNASTDETRTILREFQERINVISCSRNAGFAAGQNLAIQASADADWVLTLNPDVLMEAGFVRNLLDAGSADPTVGAVCGKLLSIAPGFEPSTNRASIRPASISPPTCGISTAAGTNLTAAAMIVRPMSSGRAPQPRSIAAR